MKASYEVGDPEAKRKYRQLAAIKLSRSGQTKFPVGLTPLPLRDVEAAFKKEIEEAEAWYSGVRDDEIRWIREGLNPDEEFAAKYYKEPSVSQSLYDRAATSHTR